MNETQLEKEDLEALQEANTLTPKDRLYLVGFFGVCSLLGLSIAAGVISLVG